MGYKEGNDFERKHLQICQCVRHGLESDESSLILEILLIAI